MRIDQLEARIQAASGQKGAAGATLEHEKKNLAEAQAALAEATAIRTKEADAFHESEKEMIVSVKLLEGAIIALEKHHPSMLQSDEALGAFKPKLRRLIHQHIGILDWLATSPARDEFLGFLDAQPALLEPDTSFLQMSSFRTRKMQIKKTFLPFKSYTPQSGQVMGVLKQMKEDFEKDLPEVREVDMKQSTQFAELKGSKEAEMKQMEETIKAKNQEHAGTRLQLVADKDDLKDTQASLDADTRFLLEVQERCTSADAEWEKRKKTRTDEIAALSEAIKILSGDELKDAQQTTFGFLQVSQRVHRSANTDVRLIHALARLQQSAPGSPDVLALIEIAKTNPFGKINDAIDKLAEKLKAQQADEVKQRDYCVDALHENQVVTQRKDSDLNRLEAAIEDLESQHKTLSTEVASLKSEISQLQMELQRAAENRKTENFLYQKMVAGQQQTQEALAQAYAKLETFYEEKHVFLQSGGPEGSADAYFNKGAPDAGTYQENSGAKGVMGLMKKLQGEAKVLEDDTISDEQNAQIAYETMISETNRAVKQKSRLITDKMEEMARVDKDKQQKTIDKEQVLDDLDGLNKQKSDLLAQCTFLLDNFDARQESRAAEIDALGEVKAILAGMKA